jgi:hypothetical protein
VLHEKRPSSVVKITSPLKGKKNNKKEAATLISFLIHSIYNVKQHQIDFFRGLSCSASEAMCIHPKCTYQMFFFSKSKPSAKLKTTLPINSVMQDETMAIVFIEFGSVLHEKRECPLCLKISGLIFVFNAPVEFRPFLERA